MQQCVTTQMKAMSSIFMWSVYYAVIQGSYSFGPTVWLFK